MVLRKFELQPAANERAVSESFDFTMRPVGALVRFVSRPNDARQIAADGAHAVARA
jgi:hypothetical protein